MAQYLGVMAKAAASSFGEGDNRSKGKKDNDLVTRLEGQAVKAIGSHLLSGDAMGPTSHPKRVGQLFNSVSSWHQDNYGGGYSGSNGGRRGMTSKGYDEWGGKQRGGHGYDDTRGGGYGGGSGNGGYGYESRAGYGGMNGGSGGLGRQGYYDNGNYDGYGNRGRMNDGYMGGGGYGY